jgi:hypothetical protein
MMNIFSSTKIYITSVFLFTLLFLVACQPDANKLIETCFDEVQNQDEAWIDCGGPNCPACLPSCIDCILNGDEIKPDCGGVNCPDCATCEDGIQNAHWINTSPSPNTDTVWTLVMEKGIDCGYPCANYCPPTCDNGIIDGAETGIDCGGPDCNPCANALIALCNDGIRNGNEIGIDCDTIPGFCPDCGGTCNDGIMNQDEQGIDCGSFGCIIPCGDEYIPTLCPIPTCWDGIMNGGETGVDCGGPCQTEEGLEVGCPPGTQFDGIQNASNGAEEEGIDCGGNTVYFFDGDSVVIPCPTCDDDIKNGFETGIDCGGNCNTCPTCCDGIKNGDELEVDCIWSEAPNPYNHPCLPCKNYVRATVNVLGSPFPFEALGVEVTAVTSNLGGPQITITATQADGLKLVIKYTDFLVSGDFVIINNHNLNSTNDGVLDPSSVAFTYPTPVTTWSTAALPLDVTAGSLNYSPTQSSINPERYFRGGGNNIEAYNYNFLNPPFNIEGGEKITISNLDWGVFF